MKFEMVNTVAIHQADFLPWSGFWAKAAVADSLILMTGVEFSHGDTTNRVKLDGKWMTLPLLKGPSNLHKDLKFDRRVLPKMVKTIEQTLMNKRVPYGQRLAPIVQFMADSKLDSLTSFNISLIEQVRKVLGLTTQLVIDQNDLVGVSKTERLQQLIQRNAPCVGKNPCYLSGMGGKGYLGKMDGIPVKYCSGTFIDGTILQLIAREEDPLMVIRNSLKIID